jgi:hypothetical protein
MLCGNGHAYREPSQHEGQPVEHVEPRGTQLESGEEVAQVHERVGQLAHAAHQAERVPVAALLRLRLGSGSGLGFLWGRVTSCGAG